MKGFDKRGRKMTDDVKFKSKPSQYACRFCPYRNGANKWVCGTGDCELNPPDNTEIPTKEYEVLLSKLEETVTNVK
jgi:hypothetical protein